MINSTKTFGKKTKSNTYIKFEDEIYLTNNSWENENREFKTLDQTHLNEDEIQNVEKSTIGWVDLGICENLDSAIYAFIGLQIEERKLRKIRNENFALKQENRRKDEWDSLKNLEIIPSTLNNIRIVLEHLNQTNWGGWNLPKMSIGYSAHQYDCDGKSATTMKLDKKVEGTLKFQTGGARGHLEDYIRL